MPGYIHALIQVEVSILVKDGVWTGREKGTSERAGLPHCPKLLGAVPSLLPTQTRVSWEQDQLWPDPYTPS